MTLKIKETSNNVFFFRNVLRSCNILWTTTYTVCRRKRFHVPRTTFDVCQILFCFCMGFFSTSNARGWLESASNNIPHFSISTEKYRQLGIPLIPRCKSKGRQTSQEHQHVQVASFRLSQHDPSAPVPIADETENAMS